MLCVCFLFFFFYCYAAPRDLPSFPTRRSSDLAVASASAPFFFCFFGLPSGPTRRMRGLLRNGRQAERSEEHTSELQSRLHLVCRLLLEKKKKNKKQKQKQQSIDTQTCKTYPVT